MTSARAGIAHQPHGHTTIEYLPLEEVRVKGWVVDVSSRIVLSQTFYNPSDEPTGRAKYVFPLPADAAVCAFELELEDGSIIVGEVKENEEATLNFTRAVEQRKMAALVERVTDDIFTISLGSIPGTTRVVAHLTFVMDLLNEALRDHVRLQLPMYIAERYGTLPTAMHDAASASPRTRVHVNIDIQTSDVIYGIRSPTHPITLKRYKGRSNDRSQRRMSAVWKFPEFLTSDFVITIHAEGMDKPRCFAEVLDAKRDWDGESSTIAMQLTLVPQFLAPKIPSQEYIFIIDRSGSMSGASIETAKQTLSMLLRLLPSTQTMFNIFSFGDTVSGFWQNSHELDQTSLAEAILHVASMSANYGGTEIPGALQSAFNSRGLGRPAVVFLLTDGQIHGNERLNPWAVISNAVQNSPPKAPLRLFVLGIGTGVSSDVCSKMAHQGNGEYLFALSAEDICGKCSRLLNAGRSKNIERIDIDWRQDASSPQASFSPTTIALPAGILALAPPPLVQQAPRSLTGIFAGFRFTVFAITWFKTVPTSVKLTTKLEGDSNPHELIVDVIKVKPFHDTDEQSVAPIVHTLVARKLIMELDSGIGLLPTPASDDALMATDDGLRKAGIVRLGLTYQLVSKHTSFVAVQKGDERTRNRRRGSGSMAWAKSRLRQAELDIQEDTPTETPTLLDDLISGVSSLITSVFGLFSGSVATFHPSPFHDRPNVPGAYNASDSGASEGGRGRDPRRAPNPRRARSTSSHSADSFSSLSSLEGSSTCSSCWTFSRPSSPLPQIRDPIERAPTPEFLQDASAPGHADPIAGGHPMRNQRVPIPQQVYDLIHQMELNGSFTTSPLLTQLVGETVLGRADELGIDKTIWATVLVTAYMKIHLQSEPDLFELISEKAKEFVETRGSTSSFDQMVREAVDLLEP